MKDKIYPKNSDKLVKKFENLAKKIKDYDDYFEFIFNNLSPINMSHLQKLSNDTYSKIFGLFPDNYTYVDVITKHDIDNFYPDQDDNAILGDGYYIYLINTRNFNKLKKFAQTIHKNISLQDSFKHCVNKASKLPNYFDFLFSNLKPLKANHLKKSSKIFALFPQNYTRIDIITKDNINDFTIDKDGNLISGDADYLFIVNKSNLNKLKEFCQ